MHHGNTDFHCDKGHEHSPICKLDKLSGMGMTWYAIHIAEPGSLLSGLTIHCDEQQLVAFKNSVISEYERIRRER